MMPLTHDSANHRAPYNERAAVFSPDGHWIAYTSDESGQVEVLITAFPGPGPRKAVSTGGGDLPRDPLRFLD